MASSCGSHSASNGHNSRISAADSSAAVSDAGSGEIMLFGVRVKVDPMRKSVSMNDLSQYEQPQESSNADVAVAAGYASADDAVHHHSSTNRERKRGIPWTEEEHKLFLVGLQKVGKGDWRGISRNFVKTRTPTQVASHAQKYFLRRNNLNRRRRRSSLFDITTDSVNTIPMEEEQVLQDNTSQLVLPTATPLPQLETSNISVFSVTPFPVAVNPVPSENLTLGQVDQVNNNASKNPVLPIPFLPTPDAAIVGDLNLYQKSMVDSLPLSLCLSLSSDQNQSSRHSTVKVFSSFHNGDGIITVVRGRKLHKIKTQELIIRKV
ncbi:transcription factor MYB1R1-like [Cornus florida]|uniref:transcription factor MYB1R1-like n=1 Tax=Cornus florida TaxID=4283 RepID=UPI0028A0AE98|nr:transcription factor MYB1R1-like [Cornus florida]